VRNWRCFFPNKWRVGTWRIYTTPDFIRRACYLAWNRWLRVHNAIQRQWGHSRHTRCILPTSVWTEKKTARIVCFHSVAEMSKAAAGLRQSLNYQQVNSEQCVTASDYRSWIEEGKSVEKVVNLVFKLSCPARVLLGCLIGAGVCTRRAKKRSKHVDFFRTKRQINNRNGLATFWAEGKSLENYMVQYRIREVLNVWTRTWYLGLKGRKEPEVFAASGRI